MWNCTDDRSFTPDAQMHLTFWPLLIFVMLVCSNGLWGSPRLKKVWEFEKRGVKIRVSVWYIVMMVLLVILMSTKLSGQAGYDSIFRDMVSDPGYECNCTSVCMSDDEPGVSNQDCQDRTGTVGKVCWQMVGRSGCFDYDENCVDVRTCTNQEEQDLKQYHVATSYLDGLNSAQILAFIGMPFILIVLSLFALFPEMRWFRTLAEVGGPIFALLILGGSLWELMLTDFISAPMGESMTMLPALCPEDSKYQEAHARKQRNSWATGLFVSFMLFLALEPCLVKGEREKEIPAEAFDRTRGIKELACFNLKGIWKSLHASWYVEALFALGVLSFLLTGFVLTSCMDKVNNGSPLTESYFSYGATYGLLYTSPLSTLTLMYGYELFSVRAFSKKTPENRGPACYILGACMTVAFAAALVCEVVMVIVWVEAWLVSDMCYGLNDLSFIQLASINTCDSWSEVYDQSFGAMVALTPVCLVCTFLGVVRTWGIWCHTYQQDMLADEVTECAREKPEEEEEKEPCEDGHDKVALKPKPT